MGCWYRTIPRPKCFSISDEWLPRSARRIRYNRKAERSTMHALPIPIPTEPLQEFCQRNHIRRLAVFGSALRKGDG